MASGLTPLFLLPYPLATDPVDVHGDVYDLADRLDNVLNTFVRTNVTNTFTATQIFSVNSADAAVRITQVGAGEALRVEDEANPDSSPFVITATGDVGIGTASPSTKLSVSGNILSTGTSTATSFIPTGSSVPTNGMYLSAANTIAFASNSTLGIILDSQQRFLWGHSAWEGEWYTASGTSANFALARNSISNPNTATGLMWIVNYNGSSGLTIARSNGANIGDRGTLLDGDDIGLIMFAGDVGSSSPGYTRAGFIRSIVSGTPTTSGIPAIMQFALSDGSAGPAEKMRIGNGGIQLLQGKDNSSSTTLVNDYPVVIHRPSGENGNQVGISFSIYTNTTSPITETPGAAIVHERLNNNSQGDLVFKTKESTASLSPVLERMRINYLGLVGIGKSPSGSMVDIANNTAANVALRVAGASGQSTNLQEWRDSSDNLLASMSQTGAFSAVTKSFDIEHPTKENMRLRYTSLEGPENGVYVRGKSKDKIISLPDYWTGLVHDDSITVQLTAIGSGTVYVDFIANNAVKVGGTAEEFYYFIQAERKDIDKLIVEY